MKRIALYVVTALLVGVSAMAAISPSFQIHGVLTDDNGNTLPDGDYSVSFTIHNSETDEGYFYGTTKNVYQLDGVFSVVLPNLNPNLFDEDKWLELTMLGESPMTPRIPILPVPVALRASTVDPAGAVISLNGKTGELTLVGGTNVTITPSANNLVIDAVGGAGGDDGDWGISGADLTHNTAGVVALGTATPTRTISGHALMQVQASLYPGLALDATNPTFGRWLMYQNGTSRDLLFSRATSTGLGTAMMILDDDGQLGVGKTPETTLDIDGGNYMLNSTDYGDFQIGNSGNALQFGVDVAGSNGGRTKIRAVGTSPLMNLALGDNTVLSLQSEYMNYYALGSKKASFWGGDGDDLGGQLFMYGLSSSVSTVELDGHNGSGGSVGVRQSSGTASASISATSSGGLIQCRDAAGIVTVTIDGQYSDGNGRVRTEVLEITGGSDLSEQFKVSAAGRMGELEPGLVVSIDPQNPGELQVCRTAYDRKVVGVISGAGGVRPGMLMGQKGSVADGDQPIALTGRVYVQADAINGAIEPGDLLTTSEIAGHAMKVSDHSRANGAILGKAMTGLADGRGLVLILVSLQ